MLRRATSGLELPNLWSEAVESLSDDDQRHFGFSQHDKRAALESLLQTIENEKENTVKSQLVIRRSHSKPIVLRDVFTKVVSCIDKFKSVGDTVTQYDPGHAALPWAAVHFVLQAAISEQKIYEGMIEGIGQVADVIARYAWIETLYLHASSRMRTQLQNAITKLYVAVLNFLTKARRYYAERTVQRGFKSLAQSDEKAVTKYLKAISDEEEKSMEGGFSSLLQRVGGIGNQIADLKLDLANQVPRTDIKREDLIRWIDAVSTQESYHTAKNARHRDTCDWILQLKEFQDWVNVTDRPAVAKVLWLHGKPGSGKTILSARIAEHLYQERPKSFALYFCFYGAENKRVCNGILRGWIAQILKDDDEAFSLAADPYKERDGSTANVNEIWHLFRLINTQRKPRYYLIDGFDECEKQQQNQPQHSLRDAKTTFLVQMNETVSGTGARVIIVSRPDAEIRDQLQLYHEEIGMKGLSWHHHGITLSDTSDDLRVFAAGVMDDRVSNRDTELRQELATNAAVKADGMFLWIKLLYSQLSRSKSPIKLRTIIADTPSGLDQAYERDLQNILNLDSEERERAMAILRWTLFSFQPLTIKQLAEALLVEFEAKVDSEDERPFRKYSHGDEYSSGLDTSESLVDDNDGGRYLALSKLPDFGDEDSIAHNFLTTCDSLLELRSRGFASVPEDLTIHFVHFSVKEYLLKTVDSNLIELQGLRQFNKNHGHKRTSHICLQYLLYNDFRQDRNSTEEQFNDNIKTHAFLDYTGIHWGWHANRCRPFSQATIKLSNDLLDPLNRKWLSYSEVAGGKANGSFSRFYARFQNNYPSPLFYASLWGIVETMGFLITERAQDVNHIGGLYGSPLKAAAAHGFEEAVKLLLDKGADIDLNSGQFGTAIQTAAARGQIKIAELLLECKPDVNLRGGWWLETPVLAAARISSRRTAGEMVRMLIQAGADVATTDSKGATAMHKIAANGATKVLKVLVQNNALLDTQDNEGTTPLMLAIEEGRQSAVDFLVTSGADVNLKNKYGLSALHFACEQPNCMSILLAHGCEVDARDGKGATALQRAVSELNISAVRVLVENGANLNIRDEEGMTPLHVIAGNRLNTLDEAVSVEPHGRASLILDLLLSHGADVEVRDEQDSTPLHHCALVSNPQQARPLIDPTSADIEEHSLHWRDSLTIAESLGEEESRHMMKSLLEHGANPMAKNKQGRTPLDVLGTMQSSGDSETGWEDGLSDDSEKPSDDLEQGSQPDRLSQQTLDLLGVRSKSKYMDTCSHKRWN